MPDEVCYAITAGEYSSFFVLAIYTDKALFDAYCEMCIEAGSPAQTEEIPLNPAAETILARIPSWYVVMDWDGNMQQIQATPPTTLGQARWNPRMAAWMVSLPAPSPDAAVKGANEQRLVAIAEGCPREEQAFYKWADARRARGMDS